MNKKFHARRICVRNEFTYPYKLDNLHFVTKYNKLNKINMRPLWLDIYRDGDCIGKGDNPSLGALWSSSHPIANHPAYLLIIYQI